MYVCESLSCVWLFVTPWTVAHQAPLSMEFSRQEYWSGLPFASPGDLPDPGMEPASPALQADSSPLSQQGSPSLLILTLTRIYHLPGTLVGVGDAIERKADKAQGSPSDQGHLTKS